MVPLCRQLGRMVQVRTVMECLMAAGVIRGFAEVLALAEVSAEAEAGAVVAAAADLVIDNRFKLAISRSEVNCRKDGYYAKR